MNARRALVSCMTAAVCMLMPFSAFAEETESIDCAEPFAHAQEEEQQRSSDLIYDSNLSIYNNFNNIYITANTTGYFIMGEIGEIDIVVQKSTNGVNGWSTYTTVPKQTNYNSSSHYMYDYEVSVVTGYYYRVQLTHYAKEQGWLFPDSQSIPSTSGIVRIM